jgi:hypothetical protein
MLNRFISYFKGTKHTFHNLVKAVYRPNLDKGACLAPANYAKLTIS